MNGLFSRHEGYGGWACRENRNSQPMMRNAPRCTARRNRRSAAKRIARAILLTLEGRRAEELSMALGVHVGAVRNWRGLFAHGRVAALRQRKAPGRRAEIGYERQAHSSPSILRTA
jgi:hypothetical protein